MEKKLLTVTLEIQPNNTPQNWIFSKEVSGVEQLALWVILRELADKNIKKMLS